MSVSFDFLTPYPSVKVEGKCVCQGFRVSFFCEQPLLLKLVNFYGPLLLIICLNAFHVLADQEGADYIANTSAIALALVFLLPLMYPKQSYQVKFGLNEWGVVGMFLAQIISLVRTPLTEEDMDVEWKQSWVISSISIFCSSSLLLIPTWNLYLYKKATNDIIKNNGDFNGLPGRNVSEAEYEKNKKIRDAGRQPSSSVVKTGGWIRAAPMKYTKKKPGTSYPYSEYMTCNGWNAGFQLEEMKNSWVWE